MNSRLAIVLGAISAAAILGTGVNVSASTNDSGDHDTLLTKAQWAGIMTAIEECQDRGSDSIQTADAITAELEQAFGADLHERGLPDESIAGITENIGWIAVQHAEIVETLQDLRDDGATCSESREVVTPMTEHYRSLVDGLAEVLDRYGLTCYLPHH